MAKWSVSLAATSLAMLSGAVLNAETSPQNGTALKAAAEIDAEVVNFVEKYCADCHNDFQMDGDRNFDPFLTDPSADEHHFTIEEMLDQLNRGTMPKQRDGVLQPSDTERRSAIAALSTYLNAVAALKAPERTPLRRLSNTEYRSTVRHLLGVDINSSETALQLTADANVHGLTKIAVAQTLSQRQLNDYVIAAQQYLDEAFSRLDDPHREPMRRVITPQDMMPSARAIHLARFEQLVVSADGTHLDLGHGRVTGPRPVFARSYLAEGGAPTSGRYVIRITAEAKDRIGKYDPQLLRFDPRTEPLKLALGFTPSPDRTTIADTGVRQVLGYFDLPDDGPRTFEVEAMLPKGGVPMFFWPNAPRNGTGLVLDIIDRYHPEFYHLRRPQRDQFRFKSYVDLPSDFRQYLREDYDAPRVRVHSMEIIGPLADPVPGAFTTDDLRRFVATPSENWEQVFIEFASKAFRRPVSANVVKRYVELSKSALKNGADAKSALKLGFAAVMSSPRFLYLYEGESDGPQQLDGYSVASRMSYFLWNAPPDDELIENAASGALLNSDTMRRQIRRMIADERTDNFVSAFINAWLRLDQLGTMPPDRRASQNYYQDRLETAMRRETELVFADVFFANRPAQTFLNSDFTYVNGGLARHYKIDGVDSEAFQRIALSPESPRRGIIGHASVLTASANGIDTSPVVRGVWILENLLGTPPAPPPPDVPAIEPDQRGATTIRELLAKHRDVQACADCHANIDPYGFPLEVFGPTGELRRAYPALVDGRMRAGRGALVDAHTELPNGTKIEDLSEFSAHLLSREDDFQMHLIEKLMAYGIGREPTFRERLEIDRIADELEAEDGGFQDMVVKVMMSEPFLNR